MTPQALDDEADLTRLLGIARRGDAAAAARVWEAVYPKLRLLAHGQLSRNGPQTLETSALIHEAYLRLAGGQGEIADRHHFLSIAAKAMRQIVVDYVRRRDAEKRGGKEKPVVLESFLEPAVGGHLEKESLLDLDRALTSLEDLDPRLAKIVEMRFFAGLTVSETAEALEISEPTVKRETRIARAFLHRELGAGEA